MFAEKKKKKKYIFLVLPFEEISIQPELSSPTLFRIQGGGPLGVTGDEGQTKSGNPLV